MKPAQHRIFGAWGAFALVACLLAQGCETRHRVRRVEKDEQPGCHEKGVFYCLPRTVIVVDLPVTRRAIRPSGFVAALKEMTSEALTEFRESAARIGLTLTDADSPEHYEVGAPTLSTRTEADPSEIFYVDLGNGWMEDCSLTINLTAAGTISDIDAHIQDKTAAFVTATLESVAKIAGTFVGAVLKSGLRAGQQEPDKAWKEIISAIEDVRKRRLNLISGVSREINPQALELMLKELDSAEQALTAVITGDVEEKTIALHYEFRLTRKGREKEDLPALNLIRIDQGKGTDFSGCELPRALPPPSWMKGGMEGVLVTLKSSYSPGFSEQPAGRLRTPEKDRSFYYRIPATVLCQIIRGDEELVACRLEVAQLGTTISLPDSFGSVDSHLTPIFYSDTGALKSLTVSTKSMDPEQIAKAGEAANQLAGAVRDREVNELQRQIDLAKKKKELKDALDALKPAQ